MKKAFIAIILFAFSASIALAQPKYVFYFIGDGMGVNQVQMTEMYRASIQGRLGIEPLLFTQFPVASMATTYSYSSNVTDSAASGTALSSGTKTINYTIGVDPEGVPVKTIASIAKANGKKVGIMSSVGANHATPGAFFGHQSNRNKYNSLVQDMVAENFDFYGGSGLMSENNAEDIEKPLVEAGYTLVGSLEDYSAKSAEAKKVLFLPGEGKKMTYAIDTKADVENSDSHIDLAEILTASIDFLMKDNKKGFFIMAEGGKIDGACHGHDAATTIEEIMDLDKAVAVAYEFYKKYPKQTLIVVTADHETGGLTINPHGTELSLLQNQKYYQGTISDKLRKMLRDNSGKKISWENVKDFLSENLGLWKEVPVKWEQEKALRDIYEATIARSQTGSAKDLYDDNASIVAKAVEVLDENAGVHWTTSHSSGLVPVFAVGAGQEAFSHKTDNAEIPMTIAKIAGYKK